MRNTVTTPIHHFVDMDPIDASVLRAIVDRAAELKKERASGKMSTLLAGKKLAMIFEKNSTRTRVSFEVAMHELGGYALHLAGNDTQLGRGESISDTARVLSRYVDCMMMRTYEHRTLTEMAEYSSIPVINGLTDYSHPCQVLADILTYEEHRGPIKGKVVTWVGDGNNVANSWISASAKFGFALRLACPRNLMPDATLIARAQNAGGSVSMVEDPAKAVEEVDLVTTDTWVSMGSTDAETRMMVLVPYQVNAELMSRAKHDALFMHCLPAHRGEEVTPEVIDGPQSVVWDEAENRLHVQKAVLLWCLNKL